MIINNIQTNVKKVNFKGMEQVKGSTGNQAYEFFLPYDSDKYNASIEFVQLKKNGTDFIVNETYKPTSMPLDNKGRITVNPARLALDDQPFAYRFKLTDKKDASKSVYHTDSGLRTENTDKTTDKTKYVIVFRDRAPVINPGGQIIHLMPDSHNPGYEMKDGKVVKNQEAIDKALSSKRNHFNQYGGNIEGIIQDIPRLSEMGYDFILSTPIFGGDERSSHGYWTTNPFQMTQKNGTLNDFKRLNVELFKKDMSLIADGAFVNEGMEGYRIKHILKWGQESPYYNNFRITGTPTIANLPNVDPQSKEGKEIFPHIKLNIVNANNSYSFNDSVGQTSQKRDPQKLTYVQIYDDRLISEKQREQIKNGELLTKYENYTTGNHYEINTNNHSALLIPFEIPTDEIADFEKRIKENKKDYTENRLGFLETVLTFKNFRIGTQANGIETWDGNADIAKLRYGYSNADEQKATLLGMTKEEKRELLQGALQNQDHIQKVGSYWTKLAKNELLEHSAKALKNTAGDVASYKNILDGKNKELNPRVADVMTEDVIKNIAQNKYYIPQLETTANVRNRLAEDLMNIPLETIGFSPDVTAILGSPFLSKKAFNKESVEKTRYQFNLDKGDKQLPEKYSALYSDMDDFYMNDTKSLVEFALDVVKKADTDNKLISKETHELTNSGKLILPLIADDILKFAIIKSLAPNIKVEIKDGKLEYDEKALRNVNINNMGVNGNGISAKSPTDEAKQTLDLMKKGLANISDADKKLLADNIKSRFQGVKENDIKMAYVLVDRTASGLNWRTDATKDTAPIGDVRDGLENLGTVMDEAIEFWAGFTRAVKKENPNAYIIAEMTDILGGDENSLMKLSGGQSGRYKNGVDLENTFVQETGVSGLSNYNFFFSSIVSAVSSGTDSGNGGKSQIGGLKGNITGNARKDNGSLDWPDNKGYLFNYPQDGIKTSHNFATNHDKPRLLSILALDNRLFHGQNLTGDRKQAIEDFAPKNGLTPNYHAIAMAKAIQTSMENALNKVTSLNKADTEAKVKEALKDLVAGKFHDGKAFNPEAFGVSPLDFAINDTIIQAEKKHGLSLDDKQRTDLFNNTFENLMQPAMDKMLLIDKIMTIMPGRNTSYSGDEYGATGYESPCKNLYAQNRNVAHREWVEGKDKKNFVADYYENKRLVNAIRKDSKLSALAKGETSMLNTNDGDILAMFRYDQMSELICLAHTKNVEYDQKDKHEFSIKKYKDEKEMPTINHIDLTPEHNEHRDNVIVAGLAGGLALGTYFVNGLKQQEDKSVYSVCKENDKYVVKGFEFAKEADYKDFTKAIDNNNKTAADEIFKKATSTTIKLRDNIVVLKNPLKKAAKQIHFGGNLNPNHIKIQAYLNSKQYLNTNQRNAI